MAGIVIPEYPYGHPKNEDYAYDKWRDEVDEQPVSREAMIEEEVYRLEKSFSLNDLQEAIETASAENFVSLFQALQEGRSCDCGMDLRDIRDAWIKQKATEIVEEA